MTARLCILTPDRHDFAYDSRWRDVLGRNAEPLRAAGMTVEERCWTTAEDLADFQLVLPLLVWGYVRAHGQWIERIGEWEREGVRLRNPAPVLRWNADKSYLGALEKKGAPVVPSFYPERVTVETMEQAAASFGTDRLVAKPRISHSAWQTIRWSPGDGLEEGPAGPAIVQPYLPAIETDGELSLIFFGGEYNHSVRKVPQPGDFRVQPEYDGIIAACVPEPDEMEAARTILAAVEEDLLYARVDLSRGLDGKPVLIELELIEPDLYLGYDDADGEGFAQAVGRCLREQPQAAD